MLQHGKQYLVVLVSVTIVFISAGLLSGNDEQVLKVIATAYNSF